MRELLGIDEEAIKRLEGERDAARKEAAFECQQRTVAEMQLRQLREAARAHEENCECVAETTETNSAAQSTSSWCDHVSMEWKAAAQGLLDGLPYSIRRHANGKIIIEVGP